MNIKELVKRSTLVIAALLIVALAVVGCVPAADPAPDPDPDPDPAPLTGRIVVGGSTSVYVVAELLAQRFMGIHPDVVVETHSVGSTPGITGARDGTFDIGMSSRWLRGDEPGWGLNQSVICHDAIAPIVNPTNPVGNLTMVQLRGIFTGNITNWAEVGGANLTIRVIIREAGSGTRTSFEDIVHRDIAPRPTVILTGTGAVRAGVAGDSAAISYVTIAAVDATVRALNVDGVAPSAATVLAGTYRIARPFLFLTLGEPSPLEKEFIDFVLGPIGQKILEDEGMVRVR